MFWGRHLNHPGRWTGKDLLLAEALERHESQICGGCGQSSMHSFDEFNSGEFEVKEDVYCLSCEQLERRRDEALEDGQKRFIVNLMGSDDPVE